MLTKFQNFATHTYSMASLIITTYNRPDALKMVLQSVFRQSRLPDDIVVADDGSDDLTKALLDKMAQQSKVPLHHVWQPDEGFRAARIRNLGLTKASSPYVIYIDGDMVLHPDFIASHVYHRLPGYFLHGSRVLIDETQTVKRIKNMDIDVHLWSVGIKNRLNAVHNLTLSNLVSSKTMRWRDVRSCNISFWRSDLVKVNGFNEAFKGWGREDTELAVRMMNSGVGRKNVKMSAVAYHLYHASRVNEDDLMRNDNLLQEVADRKLTTCQVGLSQHL